MSKMIAIGLLAGAAVLLTGLPVEVQARGGEEQDRFRFYGLIEVMPDGRQGSWVIGGREIVAGPGTEFDQEDGPLAVGGCAKVDIRGGAVHEIDSEPDEDCR